MQLTADALGRHDTLIASQRAQRTHVAQTAHVQNTPRQAPIVPSISPFLTSMMRQPLATPHVAGDPLQGTHSVEATGASSEDPHRDPVASTLFDRLHSIAHDAAFLAEIRDLYSTLPVLANLRGGLWFAPRFDDTCYFKSTDGHYGQWHLSPKRLNVHVIERATTHGGCLIVDTTRRPGMTFPDSFAKTIPIWATCINRTVLHGHATVPTVVSPQSRQGSDPDTPSPQRPPEHDFDFTPADALALHVPRERVCDKEKALICARLDDMVDKLTTSSVDLSTVVDRVRSRPLKPMWLNVHSRIFTDMVPDYRTAPFAPVVCVGASDPSLHGTVLRVGRQMGMSHHTDHVFTYCQGAADDEESWSQGLTPKLFWDNVDLILSAAPGCVASVVSHVVQAGQIHHMHVKVTDESGDSNAQTSAVQDRGFHNEIGATSLFVGGRRAGRPPQCWEWFDAVVNVTTEEYDQADRPPTAHYIQLPVAEGKRDRYRLEALLPTALRFVYTHLRRQRRVLIHCAQGRDRSVGVTVAVLAAFFNLDTKEFVPTSQLDTAVECGSEWEFRKCVMERVVTKARLEDALQWVLRYHPRASPSRSTLKKIQRFFLDDGPSAIVPRHFDPSVSTSTNAPQEPHGGKRDMARPHDDGHQLVPPKGHDVDCFHGLRRIGRGRTAYWLVATILSDGIASRGPPSPSLDMRVPGVGTEAPAVPITLGLQPDKNPLYNYIKLIVLQGQRKVGYVLLEHPTASRSCLRGMLVNEDLRGCGVGTLLVASWMRLCLMTGLEPCTNRIDKPLIALLLHKFGFVPAAGTEGTRADVTVGAGDTGELLLWSPTGLSGNFSHRDLRNQHMKIVAQRPPKGVDVAVQTRFVLGVSTEEARGRVDKALEGRLQLDADSVCLRNALVQSMEVADD
eukprot:m.16486 g.16486  ORF g.16486 m.16486 type:complete len:903 (+) comp3390_c0_seq1:1-2709(+)